MTTEQETAITAMVAPQTKLLLRIKKEYHNNTWTNEFDQIVTETKESLIWHIETYILKSIETIEPLTRTFRPEDEPLRHEIRRTVIKLFEDLKQKN